MGVNVLSCTFLHYLPNDLNITVKCVRAGTLSPCGLVNQQSHTGQTTITNALTRFLSLFVFNCLIEKCDLECIFSPLMESG